METLFLSLKLLPLLLQAVQTIETSAPVPQAGPAKMELLMSTVTGSMKSGSLESRIISQDQLLALIQAITISIVSFYNILGIFKKTPAPKPAN